MNAKRLSAACMLIFSFGCSGSPDTDIQPADVSSQETSLGSGPLPSRITNKFGMTFRLVTVDASRDDHRASFPKQSYYLQESRLTWKQHSAFRKAAFGDGKYETIDWHYNSGQPSEWREWAEYTEALSKFDKEYDHRLPSRAQWTFACMSGYEQRCDKSKPNAYGIKDLIDTQGHAEVVTDIVDGTKLRVAMGYWKDNWGEHAGKTKPKCSCEHWTACNPDADDSLNEILSGRFVLVPNQ